MKSNIEAQSEEKGTTLLSLAELKAQSGVSFGTSGVRGLETDLTDRVCYAYSRAFLRYLQSKGELTADGSVAVGGDLRPSTPRIMAAAGRAVTDAGCRVVNCGAVASPALAHYGLVKAIPTIMVTGSHIPADRNGIKFTTPTGEIGKDDEAGITAQSVEMRGSLFDPQGMLTAQSPLPEPDSEAWAIYKRRYFDFFPKDFLRGKKIGVYQHSAVIRDVMVEIFRGLGAEVTELGRSETFLPVDTEAIRDEDTQLGLEWAKQYHFDALASADGDSDRPLLSDERGLWLRGDVAGILCAHYLKAESVTTPVSSNTALEQSGYFPRIVRTKIGSPYVIAAMERERESGASPVVGYEANGGFLLETDLHKDGRMLRALPTRDAMILELCILGLSIEKGQPISRLLTDLPQRFTYSDRLKEFPTEKSLSILKSLNTGDPDRDKATINSAFGALSGSLETVDTTDGLRLTFSSGEIIHLRPSGNAPEFRCYTEAETPERAEALNRRVMEILREWSDTVKE